MGTLDNGGCDHNLPFRSTLCLECEGKGLGWIYETTNVFCTHLQNIAVVTSNKQRETGDIATYFTKFSDVEIIQTQCGGRWYYRRSIPRILPHTDTLTLSLI